MITDKKCNDFFFLSYILTAQPLKQDISWFRNRQEWNKNKVEEERLSMWG